MTSSSQSQLRFKLIYRGNIFYRDAQPIISTKINSTKINELDEPTITLIYRGNTYERRLKPPKPYQKPRTINWRWQ
jgi:hypothetical protein